jgi:hypothetical protein
MRNLSLAVRAIGFLVVAGCLGLLIGWLVTGRGDKVPALPPPPPPEPVVAVAPLQPAPAPASAPTEVTPSAPAQADAPQPNHAITDFSPAPWETQLENILLSDDSDSVKADKILAMIPNAPPDAQVELTQHLVNMVQDDHYDGAAGLLTNSTTPEAVSTVLMNDLLNRNNNLKLPMLLDVARTDGHPLQDQAREMLELLTQEDHGTNWDDWSTSINNWLAQNQ